MKTEPDADKLIHYSDDVEQVKRDPIDKLEVAGASSIAASVTARSAGWELIVIRLSFLIEKLRFSTQNLHIGLYATGINC